FARSDRLALKMKMSEITQNTTLSIIIPAYNEAKTIELILDRLRLVSLPEQVSKELIVINDCSTDETENKIMDFRKKYPEVRLQYARQKKNTGKGAAIHRGIKLATGDFII